MTPRTRTAQALALLLLSALVVAGCSSGGGRDPKLTAAITRLVAALPTGHLTGVAFTDTAVANTEYQALWQPLAKYRSRVVAGAITQDGDAGRVKVELSWTTDFGGAVWKHRSQARLIKAGSTWKVIWGASILESSLVGGEKLVVTGIKATRGDILGATGQALVEPRPVVRFGIDKSQAAPGTDLATSATRLAHLLAISPAPFVKQVAASGPKAFVEAIVLRRIAVGSALIGRVAAIPGARSIADKLPLAPAKDFAAALLGTVGPATAELVAKSKGTLHAGDDTGLSGLELRYNTQLSGTPGVKVVSSTGPNEVDHELFTQLPVAGTALHLTLDQRLQTKAQQLLDQYGPASALVAIRPSTGAILVAASGPGSDGYNTATFGQYAPGSTFKIVSSLALLRAGLTPGTTVPCPLSVDVNGKRFKNYSDYPSNRIGRITLRQAVANSCNTAFISSRKKITGTALADAAAALGFGVDHDLGFPVYFGQVPPAAGETEGAADLIGQGKILASPMAMATVVASVVHGGTVVPDLVDGLAPVTASPAKPLTAAEAASLRALMRAVVTEGSGTLLSSLPGPPVIAKTGTAEYGTATSGGSLPTHAWMVGAQGDLAVAVFVDKGESGSRTAGPVLEAFLRAALGR